MFLQTLEFYLSIEMHDILQKLKNKSLINEQELFTLEDFKELDIQITKENIYISSYYSGFFVLFLPKIVTNDLPWESYSYLTKMLINLKLQNITFQVYILNKELILSSDEFTLSSTEEDFLDYFVEAEHFIIILGDVYDKDEIKLKINV